MATQVGEISFAVTANPGTLERDLEKTVSTASERANRRAVIRPRVDASGTEEAARGLARLGGAIDSTVGRRGLDALANQSRAAGTALQLGFTPGATVATAAAAALGAAVVSGARALAEQERLAATSGAIIRATGGVAGVTTREVNRLGDEIQNLTGIETEQIREAQNLLLTFRSIRNSGTDQIFTRTTRAAVDLSVIFGSVQSSALQLGKALEDPATGLGALTRVGVTFTAEEKRLIDRLVETNDLLAAQKIILEAVERQAKGTAEAIGQTQAGAVDRLRNFAGDLAEGLASNLVPALDAGTKGLAKLAGESENAEKAGQGVGQALAESIPGVGGLLGFLGERSRRAAEETERRRDAAERAAAADGLAKDAIDRHATALDKLNETQATAVDTSLDIRASTLAVAEANEDLAEADRVRRGTLEGFAATSKEARDASQAEARALRSLADAQRSLGAAERGLESANRDLAEAQRDARNVLQGFGADSKEAAESLERLEDAMLAVERAQLGIEESADSLQEAQKQASFEQERLTRVLARYGAESRQALAAQEAFDDAQRGLRSAQLDQRAAVDGLGDAQRDAAEAQRVHNGTVSGFAADSEEARQAQDDLTAAQDRARSAAEQLASAQDRAREAVREHTEKADDLRNVLNGYPADSEKARTAVRDWESAQLAAERATNEHNKKLKEQLDLQTKLAAQQASIAALGQFATFANITPSAVGGALGFATGGTVPGPVGSPHLAVVHGGERILTPEQQGGIIVLGDPETQRLLKQLLAAQLQTARTIANHTHAIEMDSYPVAMAVQNHMRDDLRGLSR